MGRRGSKLLWPPHRVDALSARLNAPSANKNEEVKDRIVNPALDNDSDQAPRRYDIAFEALAMLTVIGSSRTGN